MDEVQVRLENPILTVGAVDMMIVIGGMIITVEVVVVGTRDIGLKKRLL
jgi:hypothetical protein